MATRHVIIVEPFACGSHSQLDAFLRTLVTQAGVRVTCCELPGKKWHWRMRASSLWASSAVPTVPMPEAAATTLFCSSMLNLTELLGLRPDLYGTHKVLFFHENQLAYPVRREGMRDSAAQATVLAPSVEGASACAADAAESSAARGDRDFHFGWLQVLSAIAADVVAFNSHFNLESFLACIPALLRTIPDKAQRPDATVLTAKIRSKAVVAYFPVELPPPARPQQAASFSSATADALPATPTGIARASTADAVAVAMGSVSVDNAAPVTASAGVSAAATAADRPCPFPPTSPLVIAWNHRWEYDKQPEVLFQTLRELHDAGIDFRVVLLGECFAEVPPEFAAAQGWLQAAGKIAHWGYALSKAEYWSLLRSADVVLSTAAHEFFGVSVVEAVMAGCYPLCPGALAYPEILAPTAAELGAHAALLRPGAVEVGGSGGSGAAGAGVAEAAEAEGDRDTLAVALQARDTVETTTVAARCGGSSAACASAVDGEADMRRSEFVRETSAAAAAPAEKQRRTGHVLERVDCRGSQHLYRGQPDLRKKLAYLARRPDLVRAWRAAWLQRHESSGQAAAAAAAGVSVETAPPARPVAATVEPSGACSAAEAETSSRASSMERRSEELPELLHGTHVVSAASAAPDAGFRFDRFVAGNLIPLYRRLLGF